LPGLIGRQMTIPAITQIEDTILSAISSALPGNFRLKDSVENLSSVIAKYGFMDLTFASTDQILGSKDKINRATIRELGFSPRPDHPSSDDESTIETAMESDRPCLEVLTEDIREQGCFLRSFLNSKWSQGAMLRLFDQIQEEQSHGVEQAFAIGAAQFALAKKMQDWFPVAFTIEDACLSNSDAIWFAKHFYL